MDEVQERRKEQDLQGILVLAELPVLPGTLQKDGDVTMIVKGGKFLLQSRKQFVTFLQEQGRQFSIHFL